MLLFVAVALGACHHAPPAYVPTPLPPPIMMPEAHDTTCLLAPGPAQTAGTLSVALPGPVDPAHAPVPNSDAERLVFAQLYETLVRVDCAGRLVPALARSWSVGAGGRSWIFTLRDDAHFWDGAPVTATEVIAGWRTRGAALAAGAVASTSRDLVVNLPAAGAVGQVADPALAVTKPAPDRGWPIGTGAYWVSGPAPGGPGAALVAQSISGTAPTLTFRVVAAGGGFDLRDVLDRGGELVVTDDPGVVSYAGGRPRLSLTVRPLAWSQHYALTGPGAAAVENVDPQDLARSVHAEARADSGVACLAPPDSGGATAASPVRRLLYDRTDRTAREVAERLVARGALGAAVPAVGLAPADLAAARRGGTVWAAVVAVSATVPQCGSGVPARALIVTRSYAIVPRGMPRLQLDADGAIHFPP